MVSISEKVGARRRCADESSVKRIDELKNLFHRTSTIAVLKRWLHPQIRVTAGVVENVDQKKAPTFVVNCSHRAENDDAQDVLDRLRQASAYVEVRCRSTSTYAASAQKMYSPSVCVRYKL